ncbi:FecR family protein [Zavarzinia aquatilis]|uniref:Iron dicitrate transport regulator FecR n=1 Tax=Zavarzinia aquatilis TaxID=2211142 RepID=A0A317EFC9_9PROT|nr:FecR family protein [Zavarzinia aquatilis]PWR25461.1 iron dicitrate transport regulator FecR [Zavarzinia aquatilis]
MDRNDLPDSLIEAASRWHIRLRDDGGSESQRAAFAAWLKSDPRHAAAFDEAGEVFALLEAPAKLVAAERRIPARRPARRGAIAAAAGLGLALSLCLVAVVGAPWLDDWRSDFVTATGEQRVLDLADGSHVAMNTDTALALDLSADTRALHLFRGEAWFDIAKDAARPFVVTTPQGRIEVTGTRFDVLIENGATIVSLDEGQVRLRPASAPATTQVTLAPGQQARIEDGRAEATTSFDDTAVSAWRRGQMVFFDAPLSSVVDQLNRYHPGRIVIANGDLSSLRISGVFGTADPDKVLEIMAHTLPVRVSRITPYLVILR